MDYSAALISPLQHPKWPLNILFLALCLLIPIAGPIALTGYMARCVRAWHHDEQYPEFDFQYFVEYLKNGLWPFLVTLALSALLVPVILIILSIGVFAVSFVADAGSGNGGAVPIILLSVVCFVAFAAIHLVVMAVMVPPMLKSAIEQDFVGGFSLQFFRDFLRRVGGSLLVADLVVLLSWIPFMILGYVALIVGVYFTTVWWLFGVWHIYFQLYRLYLEKGGAELYFSSELETYPDSARPQPPPVPDGPPQLPPQ